MVPNNLHDWLGLNDDDLLPVIIVMGVFSALLLAEEDDWLHSMIIIVVVLEDKLVSFLLILVVGQSEGKDEGECCELHLMFYNYDGTFSALKSNSADFITRIGTG